MDDFGNALVAGDMGPDTIWRSMYSMAEVTQMLADLMDQPWFLTFVRQNGLQHCDWTWT